YASRVNPRFFARSPLTFRMKKHAYESARHVVFVGAAARHEIECDLGVLPNASVIHPGIDFERTVAGVSNAIDVVFLGRWSEQKNPVTAIQAYLEASRDVL